MIIELFFKIFELEPDINFTLETKNLSDDSEIQTVQCKSTIDYPEISPSKILQLENIFAPAFMQKHGFHDGFHIHKYPEYWEYQLTYRKGGYFSTGTGKTRLEALLNQFIKIMTSSDVEPSEKELIKNQVQKVFKKNLKTNPLIGKYIEANFTDAYGIIYSRVEGIIVDVIPAGEKPSEATLMKFYGKTFKEKKIPSREIKFDRVLVKSKDQVLNENLEIEYLDNFYVIPLNNEGRIKYKIKEAPESFNYNHKINF